MFKFHAAILIFGGVKERFINCEGNSYGFGETSRLGKFRKELNFSAEEYKRQKSTEGQGLGEVGLWLGIYWKTNWLGFCYPQERQVLGQEPHQLLWEGTGVLEAEPVGLLWFGYEMSPSDSRVEGLVPTAATFRAGLWDVIGS